MTKEEKYPYPSHFGSHESMVVQPDTDERSEYEGDAGLVICEDEFGKYETRRERLDNGLADPNRTRGGRLGKLYEKGKEKRK